MHIVNNLSTFVQMCLRSTMLTLDPSLSSIQHYLKPSDPFTKLPPWKQLLVQVVWLRHCTVISSSCSCRCKILCLLWYEHTLRHAAHRKHISISCEFGGTLMLSLMQNQYIAHTSNSGNSQVCFPSWLPPSLMDVSLSPTSFTYAQSTT